MRDSKAGSPNQNGRHAPKDAGHTGFRPRLTGDMLTSSLLAFLRRWNAYGYQLVRELAKSGLAGFDATTVYRTLRQLERAGLVSSFWDTSESGPARRMYSLTKAGEAFLDLWLELFGRYQKILHSAVDSLDNLDRSSDDGAQAPPARRAGAGERPSSRRRVGNA
jgi:PadR family transcriptional regulator PadR